jgi:hypothetical protein
MNTIEIQAEVNRVLQSRTFASKAQLRKLLEILHRNIDSQDNLKPSAVIHELWPDEVRTKRSADVATEMNRLRRTLEDYYESEGAGDEVVISLPNRSAAATNGTQEKSWIAAHARIGRDAAEEHPPEPPEQAAKRRGPAKWLRVATVALAVALVAAGYFGFRHFGRNGEPKSARIEGTSLVVLNAEGKEQWRKSFPEGFGPESYYEHGLASRIWFMDLEGKGHVSVLFSYLPAPSTQQHSSTLICYSDRGKEQWRWTPGKQLPETAAYPMPYKTRALAMLKATAERGARIVAASDIDPWWGGPSQVALLDPIGKLISEYWHSGGFGDMVVADPDGTGKEKIIATGVAHGYGFQATLVVLDPDRVTGASREVLPEFQIHGMGDAQETLRLLFPRSDLNRTAFDHNVAVQPVVEDGILRITVDECLAPIGCPIDYEFDQNFELIAARQGNDEFRVAHDLFYQDGKEKHRFGMGEQAVFLKVRCLKGCNTELVPVQEKFDPVASFKSGWITRKNPEGAWSYGYSEGFGEPVRLYDKTAQNGINGQNAQYWMSSSAAVNERTSPAAQFNNGPAFNDGNVDILKYEFVLVAGIRGQYSDLIFTAPSIGDYSISGNFRGAQYAVGTVVGVAAKGASLFQSKVTSVEQVVPFRMTQQLRAGEKVVFAVGPGEGTQNTGISATITRSCAPTEQPSFTPAGEITCSGLKASDRDKQ